jgi:hypothetical protein
MIGFLLSFGEPGIPGGCFSPAAGRIPPSGPGGTPYGGGGAPFPGLVRPWPAAPPGGTRDGSTWPGGLGRIIRVTGETRKSKACMQLVPARFGESDRAVDGGAGDPSRIEEGCAEECPEASGEVVALF